MAVCFSFSSLQVPSSGCVYFTFWTVKFSPLVGVHYRCQNREVLVCVFEREAESRCHSLFVFMCVCPIFPPFTAYKSVFWI